MKKSEAQPGYRNERPCPHLIRKIIVPYNDCRSCGNWPSCRIMRNTLSHGIRTPAPAKGRLHLQDRHDRERDKDYPCYATVLKNVKFAYQRRPLATAEEDQEHR